MNTRTTNPKLLKKALSFILLLSLVLATFVSCSSVLVGKYVQVYSDGTYDEDEYYEFKANGEVTYVDGSEVISATYKIVDGDKISFDVGNPLFNFTASFEKNGNRIIIDGDEYEKVK